MHKFIEWFEHNRKSIGYGIGGLNIGSGIGQIAVGNVPSGVLWVIIGAVIMFDTWEFK